MAENKRDNISLKKEFDSDMPRGMKHLANFINGEQELVTDDEGKDDENNSFIKEEAFVANNSKIMERIVYYKRRKNKKAQVIYLHEDVKEKLDILTKSSKYKDFDRIAIASAVLSIFLDSEKEEIAKTMKELLSEMEKKLGKLGD